MPLFCLNRRSFGICAVVLLSTPSTVGELCTRCAGDIVEDCRLEAAPKPGHCSGSEAKRCSVISEGDAWENAADCPNRVEGGTPDCWMNKQLRRAWTVGALRIGRGGLKPTVAVSAAIV